MPLDFTEGRVFMPGERALYKPDEQHEGAPCTVKSMIAGADTVLKGYWITLDTGELVECALDELRPLSEGK